MNTPLTTEQVQTLRGSLKGHHLEAILTLALVTGLRRDELLSLKWQDVDLDASILHVQNSKTKSSARTIHIPPDIALLLKEHRKHQMEAEGAAGLTWANLDLVFPDSEGSPLDPHQLVKGLDVVLEQAGLPRVSFHDLRNGVGQMLYKQNKAEQESQ